MTPPLVSLDTAQQRLRLRMEARRQRKGTAVHPGPGVGSACMAPVLDLTSQPAVPAVSKRKQIHEGDERDLTSAPDEAWTAGTRGPLTRAALQGDPLAPRGAMSVDGDAAPRASAAHDLPACRLSPLNVGPGRAQHAGSAGRFIRRDWRDRCAMPIFSAVLILGALAWCWAPVLMLKLAAAAAIALWLGSELSRYCESSE